MSVNIQYVLLWLEGRHGDVCALVNGIVNNALFHSSPHVSEMLQQIIHIMHLFCLVSGRFVANYTSVFVVNWTEVGAVRRPQSWKYR